LSRNNILFIYTALNTGDAMKSDYNPGQREGLNSFKWHGEEVLIVHPGAYPQFIENGQIVMFKRYDGLVWCGRVWEYPKPSWYEFEIDKPVDTWEALQWLSEKHRMWLANEDDFSGQEELPF
ncbi:hypothetical protein D5C48_23060, partial [Salmonella enterica subsp. enterica]|nr:hypothetical protein [Salmonella enterica]MKE57711.1 hypothetical protein [Salmonella enterica subsp. enterica serovar Pomona]